MSTILTIRHLSGSLSGKSQRIALQEGQVLRLGRAPESDIKFSDTVDDSVSGTHAELSLQGGRLFVEDKRSSNGTYVNGASCPPFQKVAVPDGSRIQLGKHGPEMQLVSEAAPAMTAAAAAGTAATAVQPKESVGRATLLREIDKARQDERDVMIGEVAKARKSSGLMLGLGLLAVLLVAGGGIGGAIWWNLRKVDTEKANLTAALAQQKAALEGEKNVWSNVEKKTSPAVAFVRCSYRVQIPLESYNGVIVKEGVVVDGATGSAVVIRPGLLLTAKHVAEPWKVLLPKWDEMAQSGVKAVYDDLTVQFPGQQPLKATLVASADQQDLALLQIAPTNAPSVPIIKSNAGVNVTDRIAVLGYPSELGQALTVQKNLSGFGTEWTQITEVTPTFVVGTVTQPLTGAHGPSVLLFDASVTHGNSGGAVLNDRSELVGIVSRRFEEVDPVKILGIVYPVKKAVSAGNVAVSPDEIQSFLRSRGIF